MANNPKGANIYQTGKVPSRLEVDLVTGGATLYGEEGVFNAFGRPIIATSQPGSPNKWTITDTFVKKYNNANGTNLSKDEVQKVFTKDLVKQNNNERAAIINKNATDENKTKLSKDTKIPGVVDPVTKTKTEDTTTTPTVAENDNSESQSLPAAAEGGGEQTEESVSDTRNNFPNLRYPINIADSKQDIIKFDMHEYVPSKVGKIGDANAFGFSRGDLGPSIGSVVLPIPSGISDQNKANWGSTSMTALDIAKAEIAREAIFNGLQNGVEKFQDYLEAIKQNSGATATAVGNSLAAAAAGVDGQALLSRTTGQILNPNMELLFKGPSLRPFSFKFQLSPRDSTEANEVIKIMRFFKQGSAPIRSKSNLFLKSPHIFRIKYVRMGENGELHRGLNAFKTCALQSVGVNYTPTGNYATYSDGVMVSYDLTMSFTEITPIFNDDYGNGDNDQFIGF